MATWSRRILRPGLRRVLGHFKDRVALGQVQLKGQSAALQTAVIRATSHREVPISEEHVRSVLNASNGSQMHDVCHCIGLLMKRLHKTKSWVVALKCLTLVHKALHSGAGSIFQDQLSIYPAQGGRNYLNLIRFRDASSPFAWQASAWIRWYARYLELWIETCRSVGELLEPVSNDSLSDMIRRSANDWLVREVGLLSEVLQEICQCPLNTGATDSKLVKDVLCLVALDSLRTQVELRKRFTEACSRVKSLNRSELAQLEQACDQLTFNTMVLIQLYEVAVSHRIPQSHHFPSRLLFTDYELMNLKEVLNVSPDSLPASGVTSTNRSAPYSHSRLPWLGIV